MLKRTSLVNHIKMDVLLFSSVLEIGDASIVNAFTRAIAVQREAEFFFGDGESFNKYPVFYEPIPLPPITENIFIDRVNLNPFIKVKDINVIAASASSIVHIGNSQNVYREARIKTIRQLENPKK